MSFKNLVPMLSVADVDRTVAFYQDALQFEIMHRYENNGHVQWAFVKSGHTELMFARSEVAQSVLPLARKEDLVLYFYPDDVEALHTSLKARGYPVSELHLTFYGMKECLLTDPDGYHLSFGQATETSPTA
jgi:uncharacterized glyoxalase superfamily protein PhnB